MELVCVRGVELLNWSLSMFGVLCCLVGVKKSVFEGFVVEVGVKKFVFGVQSCLI